MAYAVAADIDKQIIDTINAARTWGDAIVDAKRSASAITAARRDATKEVFRAVALNPQSGHYGALLTLVDVELDPVTNDWALPDYAGEPGVPLIIPFAGATPRAGFPADPDEIDSYRSDTSAFALYSGALGDDARVPHDQPTQEGQPSPLSLKYSFAYGRFKFTGLSAQVPLIQLTEEILDTKLPIDISPAVVKLAPSKLVKPGDNLYLISRDYYAMGREDLAEIANGVMKVRPVPSPNVVAAQKQVI